MKIDFQFRDIPSSSVLQIVFSAEENDARKLLDYPAVNGELMATFKNGSRYLYKDVPMMLVIQVATALSIGTEFHANIVNGGFDYEKIE